MPEEAIQGMDEELQSLLSDLAQVETGNGAPDDNSAPVSDIPVPDPVLSDPAANMAQAEPPDLPIESTSTNIADLKAIVEQFDRDYGEVQANLKRDRGRIDTVIDILLKRVRANKDAETDTMSLVKALAVLADTNGHAVKLLDSRSKLLSATKSTINASQTNVAITGTDIELQKLLSESLTGEM